MLAHYNHATEVGEKNFKRDNTTGNDRKATEEEILKNTRTRGKEISHGEKIQAEKEILGKFFVEIVL